MMLSSIRKRDYINPTPLSVSPLMTAVHLRLCVLQCASNLGNRAEWGHGQSSKKQIDRT